MTNSRYQLSFYNQIILFYSPPVETYPYIHFWSLASCYLNHLHTNFCITWKNLSLKFLNLCFPFVFKAFCCICDLLIVFAKQLKNRGNLWLVWLHDLFVGAISADPKHVFFTIAMFQPPFWRLWYMKLITPLKWGSEITSSVTCSRTWTRTKQRMKTVRYLKSLRPKSDCIFSILFTIHFQRCWQGEFVEQSRVSLVGDHFLCSHDLDAWFRGDIVRRN